MVMLSFRGSFVRNGDYQVGSIWEGWPGEGQITQVFGQRSVTGSIHAGTDIAAPYLSGVYAPIAGFARLYAYGDFGNHVIIQPVRDDEYGQVYVIQAHMASFAPGLTDGWVTPGTLLGFAGYSGKVSPQGPAGTHIHFGVGLDPLISGDYRRCIDPYTFIVRAEQEDEMSSSRLGLQFIAGGDFAKMQASYEILRGNGTLDQLYKEGLATSINLIPPQDTLTVLNAAMLMRFHILGVAASDLSDMAYLAVS